MSQLREQKVAKVRVMREEADLAVLDNVIGGLPLARLYKRK